MIICFGLISNFSYSQTTLTKGDIAIVAYSTPDDAFAFATFVELQIGTEIYFTDEEADGDNTIGLGEGHLLYTASTTVPPGTVITGSVSATNFTVVSSSFAPGNSGDGLIAYQGSSVGNVTTFLHAVGEDIGDTGTFPAGTLETGDILLMAKDDGNYSGTTTGTTTELFTAINNVANWTTGGALNLDPVTSFSVTSSAPTPTVTFDAATSGVNETDVDFVTTGIPVTFSNYTADATITPTVNASSTADATDYTIDLTPLTFTADGTLNIPLTIKDDADFLDETIIIDFTVTSGTADIGTSQHTVTITDDETAPVPSLIITEVADPSDQYKGRFVEIYNNGATDINLATEQIYIAFQVNGGSVSSRALSGTLAANEVMIIGNSSNINTYYGFSADEDYITVDGNGDDGYFLYHGGNHSSGTLFDSYGVLGQDGTGQVWEYENSRAVRLNPKSISPNATWTLAEWTITSANVADMTPGALENEFRYDGDWKPRDVYANSSATDDVYISSSVTLTDNLSVTNFEIETDQIATINSGGSLIVSGTSSGNVTYNRTLDFVSGNANGWHLISSPLAAQTYNNDYAETNGLATSGTKRGLAFYNDALASGSKYTYLLSDDSNTSSFNTGVYSGSGIGYSAKRASTTGTVAFTGTINTDDVNGVAVSTSGDGFNLLGVPYTSYISSQTFLTDNSNLEQTQIWVWKQGVTGGNFIAMTAKADNFILAPGQGFFVKAASGTTVNFAESNQTANADTFLKSSRTEVKLLINDGESNRFAKVYFLNNVTKGFDSGYEGETFGGIKNSLDLFSQLVEGNQGKKYQVQSLPKSDLESMVIPIGVIADAGKEITFTADAVNLSSGLKVFLEDTQTNIFTRLDEANSEYKITLTETLNGVGRFYMHTTASVLSTEDIILNSVRIFKTDSSTLKITGLPEGKTSFYLYNILGKEMMTTIFTSNGNKEISLSKLASGIYLAKIQTEKGAISKKIILE